MTRYYEPHPLVTDAIDVQRTIISDIEKHRMRFFVRSRDWDVRNGFLDRAESSTQDACQTIKTHYSLREDIGIYQIYQCRRGN